MGNLPKRTIILRRLKGSDDAPTTWSGTNSPASRRYGAAMPPMALIKSVYVFVNERGQPFARMGIARIIERGGEVANLPFPIHVHMLRHSTGYALAARGMDTRRLQHFLGHASNTNTVRYTAKSPARGGASSSETHGESRPS
jgi:site-specific recombinase XerD